MSNNRVEYATAIVKTLREHNFIAYFAGGFVRDMILHKDTSEYVDFLEEHDIDIATDASPSDIRKIFKRVIPVGEHFGVMLVVHKKIPFEVATFREDVGGTDGRHPDSVTFSTPQSDAQRRDFTINGLFFNPLKNEVLDFVGGEEDLQKGIIRTIGTPDERFQEDYLRLLRALRFSARFNFTIASETWEAIIRYSASIKRISKERIFQEVSKMLQGKNSAYAIQLLIDSNLLPQILPDVAKLQESSPIDLRHHKYHRLDIIKHALTHGDSRNDIIQWSILLQFTGSTFEESAQKSTSILRGLKASNELITGVEQTILGQGIIPQVPSMELCRLKDFLYRPTLTNEIQVYIRTHAITQESLSEITYIQNKCEEIPQCNRHPIPFINGNDLRSLGMKPSPQMGELLKKIYDLQLNETLQSHEEALEVAKKYYCKM